MDDILRIDACKDKLSLFAQGVSAQFTRCQSATALRLQMEHFFNRAQLDKFRQRHSEISGSILFSVFNHSSPAPASNSFENPRQPAACAMSPVPAFTGLS